MANYNSYGDALDPKYGEPFPVPIVMATEESLKGYGTIVRDFDSAKIEITPWPVQGSRPLCTDTGTLGGVRSGAFKCKWEGDQCASVNEAVDGDTDGNYIIGRLPSNVSPSNRTHLLTRGANYHPDGGQVFCPSNGDAFVILLALPGDDIKLENFVAFYCDGSFGINIHADIWHQPIFPVSEEATFLTKQGAIFACVNLDTVEEFGKYLLVPLTKP